MQTFVVSFDPDDDCFIVCEKSRALSFAMIPRFVQSSFRKVDKVLAEKFCKSLNRNVRNYGEVKTQMIQTPGRFEVVADKKYGAAW